VSLHRTFGLSARSSSLPVGSAKITRNDLEKESLNLYVEIKLDGSGKQQTNVVKRETEPNWDQEFRVYVK
jgi:hypothetical protein